VESGMGVLNTVETANLQSKQTR